MQNKNCGNIFLDDNDEDEGVISDYKWEGEMSEEMVLKKLEEELL